MRNYLPTQSNKENFLELEKKFFEEDIFAPEMVQFVKNEMYPFFSSLPADQLRLYEANYGLLFVYAVWTYLNWFEEETVQDIVESQLIRAISLGFDVFDKLMWYMATVIIDRSDIQAFYAKLKERMSNSETIIGEVQGESYNFSKIFKRIIILNNQKDNTLDLAKQHDIVATLIFPEGTGNEAYQFMNVDQRESVDVFFNFANFIIYVNPDRIYEEIQDYTNPIAIDEETLQSINLENVRREPVSSVKTEDVAAKKIENKPDLKQIKQIIDIKFKKDATGQYEDVAGVLEKLSELAKQNNDPKIADMLYFDENTGNFEWVG